LAASTLIRVERVPPFPGHRQHHDGADRHDLDDDERRFLLPLVAGKPEWSRLGSGSIAALRQSAECSETHCAGKTRAP